MAGQSGLLVGRIAGVLVALATVLAGATGVVGTFAERTLALTDVVAADRLEVELGTGDLTVHVVPAGQPITVTRRLFRGLGQPVSAVTAVTGRPGTTRITGSCTGGLRFGNCSVDVDISMPAGTGLTVQLQSGDARIDGAAGELRVATTTGDVVLTQLAAARPTVSSGDGDVGITFSAVPDSVSVRTGTGDVQLELPPGQPYRVTTTSQLGDTQVDVPTDQTSSHTVELSSELGDISVVTAQ